jgi:hypothetical protein
VPNRRGHERGVVAEGPVGTRWAGRLRIFRYEVRCWRDGFIPDLAFAVTPPVPLSCDESVAERILQTLPTVPTLVWGRDEMGAGEMWSCNSIISWALTRAGLDTATIALPAGGRAPGWDAGIAIAHDRAKRSGTTCGVNRRAAVLAGVLAGYDSFVRPSMLDWGATNLERRQPLPGDEIADSVMTHHTRALKARSRNSNPTPSDP